MKVESRLGEHHDEPTVCHESAQFRANLESIVEGHSVLHRGPAIAWEDGLYLGNGDIAAMIHGEPQRTRILLNKGDIWDERADDIPNQEDYWSWIEVKNALATGVESGDWSAYRAATAPREPIPILGNFANFQPAGYLEILGDLPEAVTDFQQQLSLYQAKVITRFKHADRQLGFDAYTHANHNLLVLDCQPGISDAWPLGLKLHRNLTPFRQQWEGDPAMKAPAFGFDTDTIWMTMAFPDGFTYAVVLQTPSLSLDVEQGGDSVTGYITGTSQQHVRCNLTIVTSQDSTPEALVGQGRDRLQHLLSANNLDDSHGQWWSDFWRKSWISLPDKLVENLWFTEIYKIASCSRKGGQAPGQLGHWSGYPDPPWRGDYHTNINVQENYWPIYTANRLELGSPFYDLYLGMLDRVMEETRRFGMPGARYPRGHGRSGRSNNPGSTNWGIWPGSGPWICAHFGWHYQFTHDRDFLRNCYPMFRACLDFFLAYVGEPDANGQYNVVPSLCHEQAHEHATASEGRTWGRNSPYDLALLREHLKNTIRASEILGVDEAERDEWQHVLEKVAPYPISEKGHLMEWEGIELDNSHRHLSHLYAIYPGEEIHQGSSAEWVHIGRLSVKRMIERGFKGFCGFSFPWLACLAARMGEADAAVQMIHNHIRAFVNLNGFSIVFYTKVPGLGDYGRGSPDREGRKLPNMESGSSLCAAINELLLCSPGGVIRVFPAVPEAWLDIQFSRFRAQGAFLVTSEKRSGRTCYVVLESEAGAECRLANPWPNEPVVVRPVNGEHVSHNIQSEHITFQTELGKSYLIYPEDTEPNNLEMIHLTGDDSEKYRLGVGSPFSSQ